MILIAALFTIIMLVLGAVLVYGVFFAVWVPAIFIFKIKRKWKATFIAVPLVGLAYVAAIVGLWQHSTRPSVVFENTFNVQPSADVTNLKSDLYYFADLGEVYLQFECNRTTLDSLVASQGMTVALPPSQTFSDAPYWWKPGPKARWSEYYEADLSGRDSASEDAIFIYNSQTGQANYHWLGID